MPHGWVASDFIRSTLDLFAYERESDHALVIAAGIPAAWLDDGGIAIENLRTPYGPLGYALRRDGHMLRLDLADRGMRIPPGGIMFAPPLASTRAVAYLSGKRVEWNGRELRIDRLPATIEIDDSLR